jgi:hypothetical protein
MRPVLEVAMSRFELMQQLRADLAKAKADLASRKMVDRAKGPGRTGRRCLPSTWPATASATPSSG